MVDHEIDINKIKKEMKSENKLEENLRFRKFLKMHADSDVLDSQFAMLHNEIFKKYDCSKCRNCCKLLGCIMSKGEVMECAKYFGISENEFILKYLEDNKNGNFSSKERPCLFLKGGECLLKEKAPRFCQEYPYTNKPDRIFSLLGLLYNAEICPAVYEILEELKKIYNFK